MKTLIKEHWDFIAAILLFIAVIFFMYIGVNSLSERLLVMSLDQKINTIVILLFLSFMHRVLITRGK